MGAGRHTGDGGWGQGDTSETVDGDGGRDRRQRPTAETAAVIVKLSTIASGSDADGRPG